MTFINLRHLYIYAIPHQASTARLIGRIAKKIRNILYINALFYIFSWSTTCSADVSDISSVDIESNVTFSATPSVVNTLVDINGMNEPDNNCNQQCTLPQFNPRPDDLASADNGSDAASTLTSSLPLTDDAAPAVPTAAPINDLWQRLRNGFGMQPTTNPRVGTQLNWYTHRPDYLSRMVERSKRYLHYIVSQVEKRDMPSEIALLPMVESAYNPMAYSTSHAAGIWQFIPETGKSFGLRQTTYYDGRRDIIAATNAALDYLGRLHTEFGSWELALAAYNCGEGCVQHAITKNQALGLSTDYQSLSLPTETRDYVPKLMAIKQIVSDPQASGVNLASIPDKKYFTRVTLDKPMDIALAAKLADMPVNDFISLNPAYNKPVIRSDSGTQLLLPVDRADMFNTNLSHYDQPLVNWKSCDAHRGDSVALAAQRCHVTLTTLKAHNKLELNRKSHFKDNQVLIIPMTHDAAREAVILQHHGHARQSAQRHTTHTHPHVHKILAAKHHPVHHAHSA